MMILVLPMFSVREINADSNYVIMRQVIPRIVERNPDWHFVILWPSNNADWLYFDDGFFRSKNVSRHPIHLDPNKMIQVVSFDPRTWEGLIDYKRCIWDVIWVNSVERGGLIKGYEHHYHDTAMPVVVNFHHYVLHESLNYPVRKVYEHVVLAQLTGALTVPTNIVNSDHCKTMLMENARAYLAPDQASRLERTIQKISYGVTTDADLEAARPRHETFTFAFNHRLQNYKNWRKTFEIFDLLYATHRGKFAVEVYEAGSSDHISEVSAHPYVRVTHPQTREQYMGALSRCHANVTNSSYETFCISAIDSMQFGQVLVAPNGVTFPEITGRKTNRYPMLFDSDNAQYKMLAALVDDRALAQQWGEAVRSHVADNYTAEMTARNIGALFASLAHKDVLSTLKRSREWTALVKSRKRWDITELRQKAYGSASDTGGSLAADQSFPVVKIKRLANEMGYRDEYIAGRLSLVKA